MLILVIVMLHLHSAIAEPVDVKALCKQQLSGLKGPKPDENYDRICETATSTVDCESQDGVPIYHFDFISPEKGAKRILALSLIHGDEEESGSVSRAWIARLKKIQPRNSWRVIPIANPDGLKRHTRMNARGVDLNRNFPTEDWEQTALAFWKSRMKSDPRRYPGPKATSEKETICLMKQLEDFKPDFIISVHTPLGVLDFDGPKVSSPDFKPLPWTPLGNYPGSLGRLMWRDHKVPVLTIELKGPTATQKLEQFDRLQDISGTIAIQAHRLLTVQDSQTK